MAGKQTTVTVQSGVWVQVYLHDGKKIWVKHNADRNLSISLSLENPNEFPEVSHKNIFEKGEWGK